jgi:micrococcal nuclease
METLLPFLFIVVAVYMVLRSLSRTKRKIRKYTKHLSTKRSYKSPHKSQPLKKPIHDDQKPKVESAHRANAQNAVDTKAQIEGFPEVKVEHVIDGDTAIVVKGWHKIKVRLDSIDCPEYGQHWGDTAKFGLIKLIGGRKVRLEEHGLDRYERILATIYVQHGYGAEWMNVNERMVTLGHAWVMRRFYNHLPKHRQDKLNRLEKWARSKKVGLWKTPNLIPPWKWRSEG